MNNGMVMTLVCAAVCIFRAAAPAAEYTLSDVLARGAKHADEVKKIDLAYRAGKQDVNFFRAEAMPNVSFGMGGTYIASSIHGQSSGLGSSGGMSGSPGGGGQQQGTGGPPSGIQTAPGGGPAGLSSMSAGGISVFDSLTAYDVNHFQSGVVNWNLSLQQPLITFGRVMTALKMARIQADVLTQSRQLGMDVYFLQVIQAFNAAYLSQQSLEIANKALANSEQLHKRMKIELDGGAGSQRDFLRIEALVLRNRAEVDRYRESLRIQRRRLAQLIGSESGTDMVLVFENGAHTDVPAAIDSAKSVELLLKEKSVELLACNEKIERSKMFPGISLVGGISSQSYRIDTEALKEAIDDKIAEDNGRDLYKAIVDGIEEGQGEFEDAFDPDYYNYTIGLQLSWTLFSGRRLWSSFRKAQLNAEKARIELEQLREQTDINIQEARAMVSVLDQNIQAIKKQMDATQRAFDLTHDDYKNGFASLSEVIDAEKENIEAAKLLHELQTRRILAVTNLRIASGLPVYKDYR